MVNAGNTRLGRVLEERSRDRGFNQTQIADALEVHQSTISRIINGQARINEKLLDRWAALIGRSADELWEEAGGRSPEGEVGLRDVLEGLLTVPLVTLARSTTLERPVVTGQTFVPTAQALGHSSIYGVTVDGASEEPLPEGIEPGDTLYVDLGMTPVPGKVVIARLGSGLIVGRLCRFEQKDTLAVLAREAEGPDREVRVSTETIEAVAFAVYRVL